MNETIERLQMERRKKTKKFFLTFSIVSGLLMIFSPLISLFASLLLAGAAAYGLSPTMNLYRGFKSSALLSVVSKDAAKEIYKTETEEVSKRRSQFLDLIILISLSLSVFIVSLILLYLGWNGIFSF